MENGFFMWGERGLVATFFLDLSSSSSPTIFLEFLKKIELSNGNRIAFEPQKMWCIIEPDFGTQGFGHPDAIIVFENSNQEKIVILFEAKTKTYSQSSKYPHEKKYNSSINGQLELNYRLTIALSEFSPENKVLKEPSWILKSNYINAQHSKLRILKDNKVIEKIVKPIVNLNSGFQNYYHIILTKDETNPLIKNNNLPRLLDKNNDDKWNDLKSNFGWINYEKLKQFAEECLENGKFCGTLNLNSAPPKYIIVQSEVSDLQITS